MPNHSARQFWLRSKRRLLGLKGVVERYKFRPLSDEFYEKLWGEAALAVGAQLQPRPGGLTQITRAGLTTFVDRSQVMLVSPLALRIMFDKELTYELMAAKGYRIPKRCSFDLSTLDRAEDFMQKHDGPVVVKPAAGTGGGQGIATGIETKTGLRLASRNAATYFQSHLLVEEQLTGASFRLLYLDGDFIDAVRRDSPIVVGDGKSTIRQLVDSENRRRKFERPISALSPLVINQDSRNTLAGQGKSPGSVPGAGEAVRVKLAVNENAARQNHIVRDQVHEEIVRTGSRLVRELGLAIAGIDVTTDDISAPITESDPIFNEINVYPGIHHHYLVANPEISAGVAPLILERLFSTRQGVIEL